MSAPFNLNLEVVLDGTSVYANTKVANNDANPTTAST
jgi:hypothetical protein